MQKEQGKMIVACAVLLLSIVNAVGNFFYDHSTAFFMGVLMAMLGVINFFYQRLVIDEAEHAIQDMETYKRENGDH